MATHSSTLAWKIPWAEESGRLQSMVSQRVRQDRATSLSLSRGLNMVMHRGQVCTVRALSLERPGTQWDMNTKEKHLIQISGPAICRGLRISFFKKKKKKKILFIFHLALLCLCCGGRELPARRPLHWKADS